MDTCIVCENTNSSYLYPGIRKCKRCGHVFADANLSEDELREIYRKNYFFGEEYSNYTADKQVIQKNFRRRLQVLQRFVDPQHHRHLLEIGSAYGFFLETAQSSFETVRGVDITEDGIAYARDVLHLDVQLADFIQDDSTVTRYDIACMWDTIEHLPRPDRFIEKISNELATNGLVAITTGDIESIAARIQKEHWRLIHPPTHLHYFSRRSLRMLLERYGFEVIYDQYCGFFRSVDNVMYNLFVLRSKTPVIYDVAKKLRITNIDFYLNMYDIMYIIARKR